MKKDLETAAQWFLRAAKQNHVEAQYKIGEMYNTGLGVEQDRKEARRWLEKAANGGLDKATDVLKDILEDENQRIIKSELAVLNSSSDYLKSDEEPEEGDTESQFLLGVMYLKSKEIEKGLEWLKKAADGNHLEAQLKLGEMYSNGQIVEKNISSAAKWIRLAAEQGHPESQFRLGEFYSEGKGVEKSTALALKWYRYAARQGYKPAEGKVSNFRLRRR